MSASTDRFPAHASRAIATLAILAISGCGGREPPPAPPPPEVGYVVLRPESIALATALPGRTAAYRIAEVRPQVSGVILKRNFVEGRTVKAGEQLYQIDPAPFEAALASARAALARAEATVVSANLLAKRYAPLAEARAVSRQDYDNAVAAQGQAVADVSAAKANVETARINLVYTRVLSPITGRTGRSSVTEGALVTANQATALVVVQQLDPIYVDVVQPSTALLRLKREYAAGRLRSGSDQAQVRLSLEDGTPYAQPGSLKFSEVTVDQGTGSVTLRAEYPNREGTLMPGMFVRQRVEEGVDDQAILAPQQGITRDQRGEPTAMVVTAENKVEPRKVRTGRAIGNRWLVEDGLREGDKLVVDGFQAVQPGATVRPREVTPADAPAPAASR